MEMRKLKKMTNLTCLAEEKRILVGLISILLKLRKQPYL